MQPIKEWTCPPDQLVKKFKETNVILFWQKKRNRLLQENAALNINRRDEQPLVSNRIRGKQICDLGPGGGKNLIQLKILKRLGKYNQTWIERYSSSSQQGMEVEESKAFSNSYSMANSGPEDIISTHCLTRSNEIETISRHWRLYLLRRQGRRSWEQHFEGPQSCQQLQIIPKASESSVKFEVLDRETKIVSSFSKQVDI